MTAVLFSPYFLLFCVTSGVGFLLAHRCFVLARTPGLIDRTLALVAALLSLVLCAASYGMRLGWYRSPAIDPTTASIVSAVTGLGIAFICLHVVLDPADAAE